MSKVIVIGGGPAGMMAAIAAADSEREVCLIEKNEKLGKKLFITGKGRCNVTNAGDMETLFANVCTNEKFLYSAFYSYDNRAVMDFLEKAGCPLKIERGDRVFPVSDHSSDIIAAFTRELKKRGVEILLNAEVKGLLTQKTTVTETADSGEESEGNPGTDKKGKTGKRQEVPEYRITGVMLKNGKQLSADSVIVCTGGASYPSTGSTGDGYRFAKETGHRMVECRPGLVPFNVKEAWCGELMGLSLKNVSLRMITGGCVQYEGFGEMLFTHFGVSGPLVLSASSYYGNTVGKGNGKKSGGKSSSKKSAEIKAHVMNENTDSPGQEVSEEETKLYIDLKPAMDMEQLDKRLLRDFEENKNKQFKNALGGLFPSKLIPVMIELSGIHPDKKVNEISREERQSFAELIKNLPLTVTGVRSFAEAIITRGGVSVKDVNPSTMESKLVSGLFFAGEVLDLDALTGGFNLQIAWSTGYLAGQNAFESILSYNRSKKEEQGE